MRGLPDFFNPDTVVAQRLIDMGQVITLLLGIAPIDGRGRLWYVENWRNGYYGWDGSKGGDAGGVSLVTDIVYIPPASLEIDAGTEVGSGQYFMRRRTLLGGSPRLGIEATVYYDNVSPIYDLNVQYTVGTTVYTTTIRANPITQTVAVYASGATVDIATLPAPSATGWWLPMKVTADYANNRLIRGLVGMTETDLSAYSLPTVPGGTDTQLEIRLTATAAGAGTRYGRVGAVLLTVDEPL